jgi:hypothetical protein
MGADHACATNFDIIAARGQRLPTSPMVWHDPARFVIEHGFRPSASHKPVEELDAGNRHVRFDERGWETERRRMAQATAPILDSTNYRPQIHGVGACQPRRETTCSTARPTSRILRSVFCVPAIIRPTGAAPGSWQGTDRAQPSNRFTIAGLRSMRRLRRA